jgi:hypothetical protein
VSKAAVQALRMMESKFKPDRGHEYYIFTFKDIVRVFKGIFSIDIKNHVGNDQLAKVLYNELNRQFLDRLNSATDIATYFECMEEIVIGTLDKRDIRSFQGSHHQQQTPVEGQRQAEL